MLESSTLYSLLTGLLLLRLSLNETDRCDCGDYKLTVNQAAKPDSYPLPCIDDLFTALTGGNVFSKLNLAHAYQLDDDSRKLTVINTHEGVFKYIRLPVYLLLQPFSANYGGNPQWISMCLHLIDDILVTGKSPEEHMKCLDMVITRLEEAGLDLKKKCEMNNWSNPVFQLSFK